MKRKVIVLFFLFAFNLISCFAQSDKYVELVNCCLKAVNALSDKGSRAELEEASRTLNALEYGNLQLIDKEVEDAISLDNRLIFSPAYFDEILTSGNVYTLAEDYLTGKRGACGSDVLLTTKAVKAKGIVSYIFPIRGEHTINISVIAEVCRKVNLSVSLVRKSAVTEVYKDNYRETSGLPYRKIDHIAVDGKNNVEVIINIENMSDKPTSFACVLGID